MGCSHAFITRFSLWPSPEGLLARRFSDAGLCKIILGFLFLNYEIFDFMAVVALCLVVYAVYRFTLEVLTCFM